jgi:penicillin-insensitive murein endopeptidase
LVAVALLSAIFSWTGCVGVFAGDGASMSIGTHAKGALLRPVAMPYEGAGYRIHADWRGRDHRYTTAEIARWLTDVFRQASAADGGGTAFLGDLSARSGGDSTNHRSHGSGRDVDIFYTARDGTGRQLMDLPAMLHFGSDGTASRWSPGLRGKVMHAPVPAAYFDGPRNWALVKAMLTNPEVEVQWIFVEPGIAQLLLAEAERQGEPRELVDLARALLHQPNDSAPHDDHMHVRLYCDPSDRIFGCSDRGPRRWLKKHWKYMQPGGSAIAGEKLAHAAEAAASLR